jgi:hypothetical protein
MTYRKIFKYASIIGLVLAIAVMAYAATVSVRPGGVAMPYWYGFSAGVKSSYYLAHPTLTANDTAAGIAATQTLTNKTLTSPTVNTPTITTPTVTGAESHAGLMSINGGYALPILAKAANYTVLAADAGDIFTNTGATAEVTLVLPEASTVEGIPFRFAVVEAYTMNVDVDDADQVLALTNAAGDKLQNTGTAGEFITLVAVNDTNFVAMGSAYGTWSDAN